MLAKPDEHCECGTYGHTIPMPIAGRLCEVDLCIADVVGALNAAKIKTIASCCGHGKMDGNIITADGRVLTLIEECAWRKRARRHELVAALAAIREVASRGGNPAADCTSIDEIVGVMLDDQPDKLARLTAIAASAD